MARDPAEAIKWYRRAAAQGDPGAQTDLGQMYERGQGVPQDEARAYMWFHLGASAGGSTLAAKNRDAIAARLTPAQITQAQALASDCVGRNYQACE